MDTPLNIENLSVGYRIKSQKKILISNISAQLLPGNFACLVGANGIGKSTLLKTIAGLEKPLSGKTYLKGQDIASLTRNKIAGIMSVVLTERVNLPDMRVYDLVGLGRYAHTGWRGHLSEADHQAVLRALTYCGMTDFQNRPLGQLSDGERQMIMVALGLAQEPDIMILDEPTAYLDANRKVQFTELMQRLTKETGLSVICSTHDLELASRSADVFWLITHNGEFHSGAPEDMALNGLLDKVFSASSMRFDHQVCGYKIRYKKIGTATIQASGLVSLWTKRVLEKAGFDVLENKPDKTTNHIHISVDLTEREPVWIINIATNRFQAHSLRELSQLATQCCPSL